MITQITHPWQIEVQAEQKIQRYHREVANANQMLADIRDFLHTMVKANSTPSHPHVRSRRHSGIVGGRDHVSQFSSHHEVQHR